MLLSNILAPAFTALSSFSHGLSFAPHPDEDVDFYSLIRQYQRDISLMSPNDANIPNLVSRLENATADIIRFYDLASRNLGVTHLHFQFFPQVYTKGSRFGEQGELVHDARVLMETVQEAFLQSVSPQTVEFGGELKRVQEALDAILHMSAEYERGWLKTTVLINRKVEKEETKSEKKPWSNTRGKDSATSPAAKWDTCETSSKLGGDLLDELTPDSITTDEPWDVYPPEGCIMQDVPDTIAAKQSREVEEHMQEPADNSEWDITDTDDLAQDTTSSTKQEVKVQQLMYDSTIRLFDSLQKIGRLHAQREEEMDAILAANQETQEEMRWTFEGLAHKASTLKDSLLQAVDEVKGQLLELSRRLQQIHTAIDELNRELELQEHTAHPNGEEQHQIMASGTVRGELIALLRREAENSPKYAKLKRVDETIQQLDAAEALWQTRGGQQSAQFRAIDALEDELLRRWGIEDD
ncbi:hypothetical protein M409DRAFT_26211 [Zasmidium cellare ATCC 36951]|uniref:Uncharacterized protein n=1 Tax=Zasmidium cellare ATCC 36951 TaxID=1080233 RepID=A0A6A6C9V4_ZASCE|nr:uncharacterized protein M409DRAFT_26211 [Zasmidium cellare ATCC 36951]KAF2163603.1 hypothetical protein M409DRAFT_26211 [Zasmidium cellare ATCC 36951]